MRSRFDQFMAETRKSIEEGLRGYGLRIPSESPEAFEEVKRALDPSSPQWESDGLRYMRGVCSTMATIHECARDLPGARAYFELGVVGWPYPWPKHPSNQDDDDESFRIALSLIQLPAAVCADRSGQHPRAEELYGWAAQHSRLTDEELAFYGIAQAVWQRLPWRAYALACLGRWGEARAVAEQAHDIAQKDRRAQTRESHRSPLKILAVLLALTRYKTDPTEANRKEAIRMLDPQAVASRVHQSRLDALFYLYNLRARHPELASPAPDELAPAARAREGYEGCVRWMARVGVHLDGKPESLKLLEQHIRGNLPSTKDEQERKMFLFLSGSYFGEVVRQELAGGQWNFQAKALVGWSLDWDMGEVEVRLRPYQQVLEYATKATRKGLYASWQETERAYLDAGEAALYAD